jgi:hypothetical protein
LLGSDPVGITGTHYGENATFILEFALQAVHFFLAALNGSGDHFLALSFPPRQSLRVCLLYPYLLPLIVASKNSYRSISLTSMMFLLVLVALLND